MDSDIINLDNGMDNSKYKLPGYLAIVSGILILPVIIITFLYDLPATHNPAILPYIIVFTIIQAFCGLYAFYRFRDFLNEYYDFHNIDKFVWPIIIVQIVLNLSSLLGRIIQDINIIASIIVFLTALATVILAISYCVVLLRLQVSLHGLLKPFAYLTIAQCICFLLFILIPLGFIIAVVTEIMLGIILLKPPEEPQVEFV